MGAFIVEDAPAGELRFKTKSNPYYRIEGIHLALGDQHDGMRSTSRRTTTADERGTFQFTQLGPGSHTIVMNVPGFKPVRFNRVTEQGTDVVVRLEEQ